MRGRATIGGVQSDGVVFSPLFSTTYRRLFCGQEAIGNTIVINLAQVRLDGSRSTGPVPNHVIWDLESNQLSCPDLRAKAVPGQFPRGR